MSVETIHTKDERGEVIQKVVELENAAGNTFEHVFERVDGKEEFEYAGEGEPSDTALEKLEEHLEGGSDGG